MARSWQVVVLEGLYGSYEAVVLGPSFEQTSFGSHGVMHGYATFSDSKTPAQALHALANRIDQLFGEDQVKALNYYRGGGDVRKTVEIYGHPDLRAGFLEPGSNDPDSPEQRCKTLQEQLDALRAKVAELQQQKSSP